MDSVFGHRHPIRRFSTLAIVCKAISCLVSQHSIPEKSHIQHIFSTPEEVSIWLIAFSTDQTKYLHLCSFGNDFKIIDLGIPTPYGLYAPGLTYITGRPSLSYPLIYIEPKF